MASTNKTAHLALNQWVLSDPLMMEDVNEDNRKIDASVFGKMELVKLKEIVTTVQANSVEIDVQDIDWTKYFFVFIESQIRGNGYGNLVLMPPANQSGNMMNNTYGILGGISTVYYYNRGSLITLCPAKNGTQPVYAFTIDGNYNSLSVGSCDSRRFNELTKIAFMPGQDGYYVSADSKIRIWGVK